MIMINNNKLIIKKIVKEDNNKLVNIFNIIKNDDVDGPQRRLW